MSYQTLALGAENISNATKTSERLETAGHLVIRYGLVLVLAWIGAMKFTAYEANGIQPLVANSPIMSFLYQILSVRAFSNLLGLLEMAMALLIGLRPLSAKAAAIGSVMAVMTFFPPFTFLFPTPQSLPLLCHIPPPP